MRIESLDFIVRACPAEGSKRIVRAGVGCLEGMNKSKMSNDSNSDSPGRRRFLGLSGVAMGLLAAGGLPNNAVAGEVAGEDGSIYDTATAFAEAVTANDADLEAFANDLGSMLEAIRAGSSLQSSARLVVDLHPTLAQAVDAAPNPDDAGLVIIVAIILTVVIIVASAQPAH